MPKKVPSIRQEDMTGTTNPGSWPHGESRPGTGFLVIRTTVFPGCSMLMKGDVRLCACVWAGVRGLMVVAVAVSGGVIGGIGNERTEGERIVVPTLVVLPAVMVEKRGGVGRGLLVAAAAAAAAAAAVGDRWPVSDGGVGEGVLTR